MSRTAFHRPARLTFPDPPADRIGVPVPPPRQRGNGSNMWLTIMLPLFSTIAMAGYLISYQKPLLIMLGLGFVVLSVMSTIAIRWQMTHAQDTASRRQSERYLEVLDDVRGEARTIAAATRLSAVLRNPSPSRLLPLVAGRRRTWERRPSDHDFLRVRVGSGRGPLGGGIGLAGRVDPMAENDHDLIDEAESVVAAHRTVGEQTAWLDLGGSGVVSLIGDPAHTRALARAMLCQVAALHAPDDVLIAIVTGDAADEWEWATWLPHTFEPGVPSEAGVTSLVAEDFERLAGFLERERDRARDEQRNRRVGFGTNAPPTRRLVVVLDDYHPDAAWARSPILDALWTEVGPELGITLVCLSEHRAVEPSRVDARAAVTADGSLELSGHGDRIGTVEDGRPDLVEPALAEAIARRLTPLRLSADREPVLTRITTLPEMLGVTDVGRLDPALGRRKPSDEDMLQVPIGLDGEGEPVVLDLKESAQHGMGPHGLVVGATGSGKSELLRTLVAGLAAKHSPELLSLVLIDFKGGATFAGVTELPHVSGLITNLEGDLAMVDRVRAALEGERQRRQQMLRDAGNIDSVREYQIRQVAGGTDSSGRPLEPMPYLLIIVDEFGELLSGRPDFVDLFVQIGRVGRSLGMHLLLATQRLEESRLRGLQSHLSYRLCLRTFSAAESRAVIGTPDAYHLPPVPGSAYLKVGEDIYTRFRVAHVSGSYVPADSSDGQRADAVTLVPLTMRPLEIEETSVEPAAPVDLNARTELAVVVERLSGHDEPVHQVWLPPLESAIAVDDLLGPIAESRERGLNAEFWPVLGGLQVPVAVADLPLNQRQEPMILDMAGKAGNVALVGAPQSGKSTFLRTLMLSIMLTGTPDEAQLSIIDFGGGTLLPFADAPHVTGVASRLEPARVRRLLAEAGRLMREREQLFRAEGIGSIVEFRQRRDAGNLPPGTRAADLFVIIDNWAALRGEADDYDEQVVELASRGLGVGVHVVLTANRWVEIRSNLRDSIGGRLELRLNDPYESEVGRALARQLTAAPAGRGVVAPGAFFQVALPRLRGETDLLDGLSPAQSRLLTRIGMQWRGNRAPRVRMLPEQILAKDLAGLDPAAIGLDEADLAPVVLDLTRDQPHFAVLGDSGSGKTHTLRTWMRALTARVSDEEARFMIVDYRRGLLDVVPEGYVGAYAGDENAAEVYAKALTETLDARRPPQNISARELRDRAWWSGPDLYLVVDDLDMLAAGPASPLAPLLPYLARAREVGFHVVAAHRTAGVGRSLTGSSLLGKAIEIGADGLLLSGDPREGALLGGLRASEQPPGRGVLVSRGRPPRLIQVAIEPDDEFASR
jgi:ESX secretion system protein EccC